MDLSSEKRITNLDDVDKSMQKVAYPSFVIDNDMPIEVKYGDEFDALVHLRVKEISEGEINPTTKSREKRIVLEVMDLSPERLNNQGFPKLTNEDMPQHRDHAPRKGFPFSG